MKVLKFGGSSIQTPERIKSVIEIIHNEPEVKAVICSAFGGITDQLINTGQLASQGNKSYINTFQTIRQIHLENAKQLIATDKQQDALRKIQEILEELAGVLQGIFLLKELSDRALDYISSFGERLSCYIITEACNTEGIKADFLYSPELIITDETYGNANVDFSTTNRNIQNYFSEHQNLQVITGFIASTHRGIISTLGRGGSDYTAAIFASALKVDLLEIWTDVNGVMTADPRKVSKAFSIPQLTYEEAMEMSHFGAKVIYAPTMRPVLRKKIPISIRNTFNVDFQGSIISAEEKEQVRSVKAITSINNVALLNIKGGGMVGISGVSARLFVALSKEDISIILISQASSEHSICVVVKPDDAEKARKSIEQEFIWELKQGDLDEVEVEYHLSVISAVGDSMRRTPGLAGKFFTALGKNGVNVIAIAQGSSERNLSIVIPQLDETKALRALHQALFLSDTKTINLFIVGVGLIGKTFLNQLQEQQNYLLEEYDLEVKIVAISNSKKFIFDKEGIEPKDWKKRLEEATERADIQAFVREMKMMNMLNSIFIDNTANEQVAQVYEQVLEHSISIVTPNKIAASSKYSRYTHLRNLAKKRNVLYLYETNVGAALPVISTLRDLIDSGDKVLKIEAILSGTLSYIFNTYDDSIPFSQVVKKAQEQGFTEPDPREDLSGKDVARKILILARESGFFLEIEDISIEPLLPQKCFDAPDVSSFYQTLKEEDKNISERFQKAKEAGKVFRYIATFEKGKAVISLQEVDSSHPFYQMQGSDNVLAFTTRRYTQRPLVVKGSGAGAEVTAAGVFADVIRVANYL